MKRPVWFVLALAPVILGVCLVMAQDRRSRAVKEFMRDKLELAQRLLETLATENFEAMASSSQRLSAMSQEPTWQVFENPDYAEHSVTFRKNVDALTKAARNKNLDAATLAYMRVTMSCVDCHKYVRGKIVAYRF